MRVMIMMTILLLYVCTPDVVQMTVRGQSGVVVGAVVVVVVVGRQKLGRNRRKKKENESRRGRPFEKFPSIPLFDLTGQAIRISPYYSEFRGGSSIVQ